MVAYSEVKYQYLDKKITERGIKKVVIARATGMTPKAFTNKLRGKTPFKWPEVQIIQSRFFPDIDKDELFQTAVRENQYGPKKSYTAQEGA